MTRPLLVILLFLSSITPNQSQCPGSLICDESGVLCSIDALNGFTCNNPDFPSAEFPLPTLCFGVGVAHNLNWWAFIGDGTPLNLTFNFSAANCVAGQGIQAGVFEGSCDGSYIWDCTGACRTSTFSFNGPTQKCEIYYVWVDGCNGDVCTYTISVNNTGGFQGLERPMPELRWDSIHCAGGTTGVKFPGYSNGCKPNLRWIVDGKRVSSDLYDSLTLKLPCQDTLMIMEVCLLATVGNPDWPLAICDQDTTCMKIKVIPPPVHVGPCRVVCFEDQPILWHGMTISSSCINPPCTVRTKTTDSCCVDSIRPIIFLPPSGLGIKDTFVCDLMTPVVTEDGQVHIGEACDELIEFQKQVVHPACPSDPVLCDTSYYLTIGRFKYKTDWEFDCGACSGMVTICPNVEYDGRCPQFFGQVLITLDWYNQLTGDRLGMTNGQGCIQVDQPGTYCFTATGRYRDVTCEVAIPECITIPVDVFPKRPPLVGDTVICGGGIGVYESVDRPERCDFVWTVPSGGGRILTTNSLDSSRIRIDWSNRTGPQGEVCLSVIADCGTRDSCITVDFDRLQSLGIDTVFQCHDDTVVLSEPIPLVSRVWSTGDTSAEISITWEDVFCVTGTPVDSSCNIEKCFVVIGSQLEIIDSTVQADRGNGDGSIDIQFSSNESISNTLWSNGDTTLSIDSLMAGTYTVLIETASGCEYVFVFEVPFTTSTHVTNGLDQLSLSPNPGVYFELWPKGFSSHVENLQMISAEGTVYNINYNETKRTDLKDVPSGIYLILITTKQGEQKTFRWVKI